VPRNARLRRSRSGTVLISKH